MPDIAFTCGDECAWTLWNDTSLAHCAELCDGRTVNYSLTQPVPAPMASLLRRAYYASTSYLDFEIGRLIDELDNSGAASNTVIVLHGDHGWSLGENNLWHKMTNFEDTARVPLIIVDPSKPAAIGAKTSALVMLVDMYPTIAALTGSGSPLSPVEGTDHSSIFNDPAAQGGLYAFSQFPRCPKGGDPTVPAGWGSNYCKSQKASQIQWMGLSVRDARWRATLWLPWNGTALSPIWDATPEGVELYDYQGSNGSDFDSYPLLHANQATDPELNGTLTKLLAACVAHFQRD
eukprot:m.167724 g.167724  ORF g.167724 m.167724 type:complete len:290 (+) comp31473_c0_seq5:207-1076(+)